MKVKNVRAGIVIISDAGLKLAPGEVVELDRLTPQVSSAIAAGLLRAVEPQAEAKPETKPKAKAPARTAGQKAETKPTVEATATPAAVADSADDSVTEGADGSN